MYGGAFTKIRLMSMSHSDSVPRLFTCVFSFCCGHHGFCAQKYDMKRKGQVGYVGPKDPRTLSVGPSDPLIPFDHWTLGPFNGLIGTLFLKEFNRPNFFNLKFSDFFGQGGENFVKVVFLLGLRNILP